ncbi:MAG: hypothetical protein E6G94_07450 [Alphaproteobacteria bacterium]|nr:MAG: hypothetical protein E6G94_07450 [Alphaproteobacteria bacterium]
MRRGGLALALLLLAAGVPAAAQPLVVSPGPEAASVTVYRNPDRRDSEFDLDWLEGYALITETRTLRLPAGESVIRFEGVAGGIVPVSAIVSGLPGGVGEKTRDARLISPGTLVDAALGRRVHIRRTNRRTGKVTEADAVIRSGPNGIVLQTAEGFEALRCTGVPETLLYDQIPEGLSDKPTLAVSTTTRAATTATVRLSYLATGFDWQASYVANLAPDGKTLDLFAWLTLANSNDESFVDAHANAIAGEPNKVEEGDSEPAPVSSEISLRCWPQGTTSDIPYTVPVQSVGGEEYYEQGGADIVVTGSRIRNPNLSSSSPVTVISAEQEDLGDLKLYRIPIPVTVAAHAQKQVALLSRSKVPYERIYGATLRAGGEDEPTPAGILLRVWNTREKGLGLPLPEGNVAVFEPAGGTMMLAAETPMRDRAVGEKVEFEVGESPDVQILQRRVLKKDEKEQDEDDDHPRPRVYEVEISNARALPITLELSLVNYANAKIVKPSHKLGLKDGSRMWLARVPANGRATLRYTMKPLPPKPEPPDEGDDDG